MDQPKYPCRNCIYFDACGDNTRTMPCYGRQTKSQKRKEISTKAIAYSLFALALTGALFLNIHHKVNNTISLTGKFYGHHEATDTNGNTDTYYSFKSNDGSVWWDLTEYQMGFIPNGNIEYVFTYNNNGTTKANKPCDCAPKYECECEVYDDEFVSVREMN